ncbi:MAG: pyruvate kinase [Phycisphaeraceae bacterium]
MHDMQAHATHPGEHLLTKIIATLGPACADVATIVRLIEEGARVFRINFSHGAFDDAAQLLGKVRQAAQQSGRDVGVLGDLPGPKIRVGKVHDAIVLETGDRVVFTDESAGVPAGDAEGELPARFATTYPSVIRDIDIGHRLLVNDGAVRMLVIDKLAHGGSDALAQALAQKSMAWRHALVCRVIVGGPVTRGKGINLPDSKLNVPSITPRDRECIDWALDNALDFLALSFVRHADDVRQLKGILAAHRKQHHGSALPVIAKIETPQALVELEGIIDQADGVMVARGDLGVEMELAEVPVIQKRIIRLAHDHGKPVIVATQMLESMIQSAAPTRAEVSDVANAIFDGADAVMLSGETAVGAHPVQVVNVMARIARRTGADISGASGGSGGAADLVYRSRAPMKLRESRYRTAALAHGVSVVVKDLGAKLVVNWSELGGGARYLSQNRLDVPILAFSSNRAALRQMNLMFGVVPLWMQRPADGHDFIRQIDQLIREHQWAQVGDPIVVVKGEPIGVPGVTNQIAIHYVGDVVRLRWRPKAE